MSEKRKLKLFCEMGALLLLATLCVFFMSSNQELKDAFRHDVLKKGDQAPGNNPFQVSTYIKAASTPGYTLMPLVGPARVALINMNGQVVHEWKLDADRARLLPNGNLLVVHGSKWGARNEPWKSLRPTVAEYTWEGTRVWDYTASDVIHHDVRRLDNGNTLFPYRVIVPADSKKDLLDANRRSLAIRSDAIVEVTPEGKIAWEWLAHDVLDLNNCGQKQCATHSDGKGASSQALSDWTHNNTTAIIPPNKWFDAGDERFRPGNIITLPRNWWTILIIDRESKEITWEYTGDYRGGMSGGHEAHMIPKGFPGEGNILVFDNGRIKHKGESFVLEIDPTSKKIVWIYEAGKDFFSNSAGSIQRFKNGNTLISEDLRGRVFEVTPAKEIVWEVKTKSRLSRSHRYDPEYCPQFTSLSLE